MRIRFRFSQPLDRAPCEHRNLTLKGRYLTLKGIDVKRSRERYTCNACGKPVVRTLNVPVSYLPFDYLSTSTGEAAPSDTEN